MGQIAESLRQKLTAQLHPVRLLIQDDSHDHAGHGQHHPDGESHFTLDIVSEVFAGKSRVQRQRLVYEILAEELKTRIHALALSTRTPEEAG